MVHPALEDCHWQKHVDTNGITTYVRPMVAGERTLDQVHQLTDGHDQLVFGVTFENILPENTLHSRLLNALVRLRYHSPIVAAQPRAGIHDPELRSWVYAPLNNASEAEAWAHKSLHLKTGPNYNLSDPERYVCDIVSRPLAPGEVFEAYLAGPYSDGRFTLFVYMSHAVLEGQAVIDLAGILLGWVADPGQELDLKWGEEWKNLAPGTVTALGGEPEGWDIESPALLEANAKAFTMTKPSHTLQPQRQSITRLGDIARVYRELDEETTSRITRAAKSETISITQLMEGAYVIATYALEPLPQNEMPDSHIRLFPCLVSTRHLRQPPHNTRESVGNLNTAFTQVFPGTLHINQSTLRERILAVARASQQNYRTFMASPHHPFLLAAESKLFPMRGPLGVDINEYAGEILGLGVIDKKLGLKWNGPDGAEVIRVSDVHLGLRQCTKRTMTHAWTLHGKLRLQVQASDIWDHAYLERFLDELVKCISSIC